MKQQNLTVSLLKSSSGRWYLGAPVTSASLRSYRAWLRKSVGVERAAILVTNRRARDGRQHHLTIVSPVEVGDDAEEVLTKFADKSIAVQMMDLGFATNAESECYFVIVASKDAQAIRQRLGLPPRDLHVTLGFDPSDVHNVPKGPSTRLAREKSAADISQTRIEN